MTFNIVTFGCKVNQYESNMMKEKMFHHNFLYTESVENADIIIVNTCTVTNVADNKCLKMIRKINREYKDAILVVTGCSSQNKQDLYKTLDADILIGNNEKSKIPELIINYLKTNQKYIKFYNHRNLEFEDMEITSFNHIRAFVKIEDGCDNFCSFCIIPYVRGTVRSKDFNKVINEVKTLVSSGHKEIVLTGIHTGRYESNGKNLSDLIVALAKIDDLIRIRISSIEITELTDDFMHVLKSCDKVCSHLHIPLQAGSNLVLKKMNRKYDLKYFEDKIKEIRSIRPDISISTDIIVGHPYETLEEFEKCVDFAKKIAFSKIHVFPYSKREGTPAALMPQVDDKEKKVRARRLIELSKKLEDNYYQKFIGKSLDILIEECDNEVASGHTSNYLNVKLEGKFERGKIYNQVL